MAECTRVLGDVVKQAREKAGLTQLQVGNAIGVDNRTILNIENYKGNPKFLSLYPLIRFLKIDASLIFYPELKVESSAVRQLHTLISDCTEEEAAAVYAVVQSAINMLRISNTQNIE